MHRHAITSSVVCTALLTVGCSDDREAAPTAPPPSLSENSSLRRVEPGDPLPWVNGAERERFEQGAEVFDIEFEDETGLGPLFNEVSCAECHEDPARGGSGDEIEFHAATYSAAGCNDLTEAGGPVYQQFATSALLPFLQSLGIDREPIPTYASVVALRTSAPLFGLGLLDAVPEEAIWALADPNDQDGDGISGRPNVTADGHIGRFGRKAVIPSLRAFNDGAFRDEMGITSLAVPGEGTVGEYPMPAGVDPTADPEIDEEALDLTDAFVRLLAPVAPLELTKEGKNGRKLFTEMNCAGCHVPTLKTKDNPVAALRHKHVTAYTDLLLHDMGPGLADICRAGASPSEFRTQPLMGLRLLTQFMHDGRAHTITEAIEAHGGEAQGSLARFEALSESDKAALVAFLGSL